MRTWCADDIGSKTMCKICERTNDDDENLSFKDASIFADWFIRDKENDTDCGYGEDESDVENKEDQLDGDATKK